MILFTLGTHSQPMDRVVAWADRLIDAGLATDVLVQAAAFGALPSRARSVGVVDRVTIDELIRNADRVVTHGGPGTILQAIALGREPLVVPRDPALGEHVDDHQQRFTAWLAGRLQIEVISDWDELVAALGRPERLAARRPEKERAVERVRELLIGGRN